MNLQIIKKYEKEFLHYLNNGYQSVVFATSAGGLSNTVIWEYASDEDWEKNSVFIINDEYVEFRKALAEGKTVQYKGLSTQTWCIIQPELGHTFGSIHVSNYRIKPDKPEFKVGDWINVNGAGGTFTECISGVNDDTYVLSKTNICYKSQATKWEPRKGEICIFWDNYTEDAFISKFNYITNDRKYMCMGDQTWWDNCMPFTGVLPQHMKDNK